MKIINLEHLGFKQSNKSTIQYKDIQGKISGEYIFFSYCGKSLPIMDDEDQLKTLIRGIYGE